MTKRILMAGLCASLAATPVFGQDDVLEKIKLLEQQIQELKALKEQQTISEKKSEQCMKVVFREKFCACVGTNLPREVDFEHYVHTMVTSKEKLGYERMDQDQKNVIDATIAVREKCIEKGFFK